MVVGQNETMAASFGEHMLLNRYMDLRDSMPEGTDQIFDLRYQDLMKDPLAAVKAIYSHWRLPYSDEARQRIEAYIQLNPQGKHGHHRYSFEDTGLDLTEERAKFAPYQKRFDVPSEV